MTWLTWLLPFVQVLWVNTQGLFPAEDGVLPVPFRENLFTGKLTTTLSPSQYLSIRYASDRNSQPVGAAPLSARSAWSTAPPLATW